MEIVLSSYGQDNTVSRSINIDFNALLETHHDRLYWMIRKIVLVHDCLLYTSPSPRDS